MENLDVATDYDFHIFSGNIGDEDTWLLVRTADKLVSVFPKNIEDQTRLVSNFQRIIDTIVFSNLEVEFADATLVTSFNYYTPDYVPLSEVTVTK